MKINKKRILMGIMIIGLLHCISGWQRMQFPEIPKFSEQSKSQQGTDLYITNFVYTFAHRGALDKAPMSIKEYETKMQGVIISYIGARGFYKKVQMGQPPTGIKDNYVTAEINIDSSVEEFYSKWLVYHFPMFVLTPFIWPFHPLTFENKMVGFAILKDREGNILERLEVKKDANYFILIYGIFREPTTVDEIFKNNHTNFFTELTDKLTLPIENKNIPESKPKFTILGEVFAPKSGLVDLKYSKHDIRIGSVLYILQDDQPVSKIIVTETFHTKMTAKIISSSVTLAKGMPFAKLN